MQEANKNKKNCMKESYQLSKKRFKTFGDWMIGCKFTA